ncbi:MAG TPA: MFS transporter [Bryobacteraceae bacterium]|nr:MFS transporter [Bryobacteraceae bacterium]
MLSSREWRVLALLSISSFLNYFDRSNLSIGATNVQSEFHIDSLQLGVLLSAFFWTYALCQLLGLAGWLADRFHVGWVLAAGFFLWSGTTGSAGLAHSFAALFAMRLLLGAGESVAYPCYSRIVANQFPEHHRGLTNAWIDAGTKCGPALGSLVGAIVVERFGWRALFIALGFGSLVWLVPWLRWMPRGKGVSAREDQTGVPGVFQIFRHRSAVSSALGLFCSNYFWYFLLTWLPHYLETERHFPKSRMGVFASLAYLAVAVSCVCSGWLSDHWIARGGTPTRVRKTFAGLGLALSTTILPVVLVRDARLAMALLILACLSFGLFASNLFAITQTLAGPRVAGKWTAVQNGFGNLAGVVCPSVTGWLVHRTGEFYPAFLVAAAVAATGAAIFVFGIGPIRQVEYAQA